MCRTIATLVIGATFLVQPALAVERVAVQAERDAALMARLERLEQQAAEQSQRLEEMQARAERVASPAPDAIHVAEVRKAVGELMSDADFRDSLFPSALNAGYDRRRGFYIDSADKAFSLNIKGYIQVRYTGANRQTDNRNLQGRQKQDDVNAFEVERLYLMFYGHIHTPKFTYRIVADGGFFTLGDQGPEDGQWRTFYATVDYEYLKDQYITAGLMRLPYSAQNMTVGAALQMMDRSLAQYAFAPDRSIGVMAHGNLFDRRLTYFAAITNGLYNPDDSPSREELDTNFAYIARLVYYIFGKGDSLFETRSGYPESDLFYSKDPMLRIGADFLVNDNNGDAGRGSAPGLFAAVPDRVRRGRGIGGTMLVDDIGTQVWGASVDVGFKYRGLSINGEYYLRTVDGESEFSQWEQLTGKSHSCHQQGGYLQAGYFLIPKKFELVGRIGGIWDNDGDNVWEWGFGCNWFPFESYNLRLGADFIRISEVVGGVHPGPNYSLNDELTMVRLVLQAGF
jgi:phosphate-selective porin OprO and OprP